MPILEMSAGAREIFRIFSSQGRVRTLEILADAEKGMAFSDLRRELNTRLSEPKATPASTVSNYLNDLRRERLIKRIRGGTYSLTEFGHRTLGRFSAVSQELALLQEQNKIRILLSELSQSDLQALFVAAQEAGKLDPNI